MALTSYNKKRDFKSTNEPQGKQEKNIGFRFVVQRHQASHLHYDFRLELGGVLKSWAVPKGPSLNPKDKRLAMMVEDHPVSYINFIGIIPEGNYGAGHVSIWDSGDFVPVDKNHEALTERQALAALHKGELKFLISGKKLNGEFALIHLNNDDIKNNSWLLIKHRDKFAVNEVYNSEDYVSVAIKNWKKTSLVMPKKASEKMGLGTRKLTTFYKPMLASLANKAFDDEEWVFEIKWDGYRAITDWQDKELKFYSRNGISFIDRFPVIVQALRKIKHDVVLDGEVVVLDENNKPNFQKLQHYEDNTHLPLIYYVFDILFLDKKDIRHLPLLQRKELLKQLLDKTKSNYIRYCDHIETNGKAFFAASAKQKLEGIIAKKSSSEYMCNMRSKEWLKVKNINSKEGVIVGYTKPRNSRNYFGALILAEYDGDELKYMGHTGTGFNEETLKQLWNMMQPFVTKKYPFNRKVKVNMPVTWIKPKLVCEVNYSEITEDGLLRHPVFMRLRTDKKNIEVKKTINNPWR